MGSPTYCLGRSLIVAGKGRKTNRAHGEPGTFCLGGEKCEEEDLVTADRRPWCQRAEQVETELLGASDKEASFILI